MSPARKTWEESTLEASESLSTARRLYRDDQTVQHLMRIQALDRAADQIEAARQELMRQDPDADARADAAWEEAQEYSSNRCPPRE